jgi:hypothetical protein
MPGAGILIMVDCSQVRRALLEKLGQRDEWLETHAAECSACRELLAQDATLARLLTTARRASRPIEAGDLIAASARDLERDQGMLGRLRGLRTRWRTGLVTAIAILPALVLSVGNPRALSPGRWVTVAFGVLLAVATDCLLAPLSRIRRRARMIAIAALALAVPAIRFLIIGSSTAPATHSGWACFAIGMFCSAPAFALLHAVARQRSLSLPDLALAGGIAGLSGNMALQLHCVDTRLWHLLAGHAWLGIVWFTATWLTLRGLEPAH